MIQSLSVTDVPPHRRLTAWQRLVSEILSPLDVVCDLTPGFHGQLTSGDLGPLQLAEITSERQLLRGRAQDSREAELERYVFVLQLHGSSLLMQDEREAALSPGDFAVIDTRRPYQFSLPGQFQIFVIAAPRKLMRLSTGQIRAVTALTFSGHSGVGALVSPFLSRLSEQMGDYEASTAARLADNVLDLLLTAMTQRLDGSPEVAVTSRCRLLLLAQRYIEDRIDDVGLNPASIAAHHHISTRYLHKLFEADGTTVNGWIRSCRLERCRRDLADAALASRPVSAIAARWGLPDPARFSRLFRYTYGVSPTEYRFLHLGSRGSAVDAV